MGWLFGYSINWLVGLLLGQWLVDQGLRVFRQNLFKILISKAKLCEKSFQNRYKIRLNRLQNEFATDKVDVGGFDPSNLVSTPIGGSSAQRLGSVLGAKMEAKSFQNRQKIESKTDVESRSIFKQLFKQFLIVFWTKCNAYFTIANLAKSSKNHWFSILFEVSALMGTCQKVIKNVLKDGFVGEDAHTSMLASILKPKKVQKSTQNRIKANVGIRLCFLIASSLKIF